MPEVDAEGVGFGIRGGGGGEVVGDFDFDLGSCCNSGGDFEGGEGGNGGGEPEDEGEVGD